MSTTPTCWIIAGANGAGKNHMTVSLNELSAEAMTYVNATALMHPPQRANVADSRPPVRMARV